MEKLLDSTPCLDQPHLLRQRMREDGYLYLRGFVDPEAVAAALDAILRMLRQQWWLDTDGRLTDRCRPEGMPEFLEMYDHLQRLEAFHRLAWRPEILQLMTCLMGEPVMAHPRNIGRVMPPGYVPYTTPPHQDFPLIQGTPECYTVWIPLTDLPEELGGLAVKERSHRLGLQRTVPALGPGGMAIRRELPGAWRTVDFLAGDLLTFHSYTVHRATPNHTRDRLRLSCDFRYQRTDNVIVPDSLLPHYERLSWQQIYEGWSDTEGQYYWKQWPLKLVARRDLGLMDRE